MAGPPSFRRKAVIPPRLLPERRQRGDAAESAAAALLTAAGLQVLCRNFKCRGGELDLVCMDAATLVVVEVRSRSRRDYGGAAASVNWGKQRRIITATRMFLAQRPQHAQRPLRFDVIAFEAGARPQWIRAAFDASGHD